MTVQANLSNGNKAVVRLEGNIAEIVKFIENYKGNDLGNDIAFEDCVTNFEVIAEIEA